MLDGIRAERSNLLVTRKKKTKKKGNSKHFLKKRPVEYDFLFFMEGCIVVYSLDYINYVCVIMPCFVQKRLGRGTLKKK